MNRIVNFHFGSESSNTLKGFVGKKSGALAAEEGSKAGRRRVKDGEEEEKEDFGFGIKQALPVGEGEPDWESGPAVTAEEYLKRVR